MRLFIVGSLDGHITAAGKIALDRGAKVSHVDDIAGALTALRNGQSADLLMVDVEQDIAQLIQNLNSERISISVVGCGVQSDPERAAQAIRAGAKEYIPLPPDPELIAAVLEAVTEETSAFVFQDPAMSRVLRLAEQIAGSDASVLITGESGTGKEVMARFIHQHSKRSSKPFIPENLLESELFGHEKGAFTGAIARRIGRFEEAHGGTLLLDEVSEMHPRLQAKLLRAIQEQEIDRVGGTQPIKVDVRLLATSNRDMEDEVRKGGFREDLYFRLNVVNLELPPLRERKSDIRILADHFVKKYAEANGVPAPALSPATLQMLEQHHWRGNVRELENTMHRAVLLASGGVVEPDDVLLMGARLGSADGAAANGQAEAGASAAGSMAGGNGGQSSGTGNLIGRTVADVEQDLILDTLQHCLGNRTHAANILGISIRTLRNKLRAYSEKGIPIPTPGGESLPRMPLA